MPSIFRYALFYTVCALILAACAVVWVAMLSPYRMSPEMIRQAQWAEVQEYQARGYVWVNTNSGLIWTRGSEYYGKTKVGKYMSESDALAAGYHEAK